MKNYFKKMLSVMLTILILLPNVMYVYAEGQSNIDITVEKNTVTIEGNSENSLDDVTLQIIRREDGKRVYIDQLKTDESGYFSTLVNLDKNKYNLTAVFSNDRVEKVFATTGEDSIGDDDEGNNGGGDDEENDEGSNNGGKNSGGSSSTRRSKDVEKSDATSFKKEETPKKVFVDIENFPWAKEAIELVAEEEIMLETSENQFAPQANITRGDFIGALIRSLGLIAQSTESFIDVSVTDPYYEDIKTAKLLGIAKGVGGNRLAPNEFITRQDMMVLIYRTLKVIGKMGEKEASIKLLDQFEDKDLISDYAVEAVAKMVEIEFIKGDGVNINPKGNTTRAEAAVVLYRIYSQYNVKE